MLQGSQIRGDAHPLDNSIVLHLTQMPITPSVRFAILSINNYPYLRLVEYSSSPFWLALFRDRDRVRNWGLIVRGKEFTTDEEESKQHCKADSQCSQYWLMGEVKVLENPHFSGVSEETRSPNLNNRATVGLPLPLFLSEAPFS